MTAPDYTKLLRNLVDVAREAGRTILDIYESGNFGVSHKEDLSPLTAADTLSHAIIEARLSDLTPDIPVLSEESSVEAYEDRKGWERFYLVDPLDGTKEFISRNGEFTVNIALLERNRPVIGVIFVPVRKVVYFAARGAGAWRQDNGFEPVRIRVRSRPDRNNLIVVASRSHGSQELEEFLKRLNVRQRISAGSSLKFGLVAEGAADIYPRFGPTWEWDTAAGHALVLEAGGLVMELGVRNEIAYNKEALKHRGFIAASREAFSMRL